MMALLASLGAGYLGYKEKERTQKREYEREDASDKRVQEAHDATMDAYRQTKANQAELKAVGSEQQTPSYTPDQGQQLDAVANAKDAQGNPYYAVGNDASGKYTVTPNFQDESGAKPAPYSPATIAAKGVNYLGKNYNTPLSDEQVSGARRTRMADLAAQGNTLAASTLDHDQKTVKFNQEQEDRAKKIQSEGIPEAVAALRRGDAAGVKEKFNQIGTRKIIGDVTITPEKRTVPNHGEIDTFTATFQVQGPDGKVTQETHNSLDLSMQIMPYEKLLEAMRSGKKDAADIANKEAQTEEHKAKANYLNGGGAAGAKAATGQVVDKPYKMDEDDKMRVKEAATSVRDAEKMVNEALRGAQPGDDPTKLPAYAHAQGVLKKAKLNQFSTHIQTGLVTPEAMVDEIFAGASKKGAQGDQDVMRSLSELASVNSAFSEAVASLVKSDPRWKTIPKTGVYTGDSKDPAPAPTPRKLAPPPATTSPKTGPAAIAVKGITTPPKYSYQAQMAEAEKARIAKQAAQREAEAVALANEVAQEKLMEEKRKAFLASRGTDTGRANLSNTTVNLLR